MRNLKFIALVLISLLLPSFAFAEIWYETETGGDGKAYDAKWIKESGEKPGPVYFTGIQSQNNVTYDLTMYWVDNNVFIQRRNSSDPAHQSCDYNGTLIDASHVKGEYYCGTPANKLKADHWTWSAVIDASVTKK